MTNFETQDEVLDRLREHRPLLLACEAIGWLHMAGKARIDFLQMHGGQHSDYKYEKWGERESPPFPWNDRLKWVQDEFPLDKNNAWPGEQIGRAHV